MLFYKPCHYHPPFLEAREPKERETTAIHTAGRGIGHELEGVTHPSRLHWVPPSLFLSLIACLGPSGAVFEIIAFPREAKKCPFSSTGY